MAKPESSSFPYLTSVRLRLVGRLRTGGYVTVQEGNRSSRIKVPLPVFGALTLMVWNAKFPNPTPGTDPSAPGFVTAKQFQQFLGRILRKAPAEINVNRIIHEVRAKLAKARASLPPLGRSPNKLTKTSSRSANGAMDWAHELVEFQEYLGHRLSTAPADLDLELLPDEPKGNGEELFPSP